MTGRLPRRQRYASPSRSTTLRLLEVRAGHCLSSYNVEYRLARAKVAIGNPAYRRVWDLVGRRADGQLGKIGHYRYQSRDAGWFGGLSQGRGVDVGDCRWTASRTATKLHTHREASYRTSNRATHAKPVCRFTPASTVEIAKRSNAQWVSRPRTILCERKRVDTGENGAESAERVQRWVAWGLSKTSVYTCRLNVPDPIRSVSTAVHAALVFRDA